MLVDTSESEDSLNNKADDSNFEGKQSCQTVSNTFTTNCLSVAECSKERNPDMSMGSIQNPLRHSENSFARAGFCQLSNCKHCGVLPLHMSLPLISQGDFWRDFSTWDDDGGLSDIIRQMHGLDMNILLVEPPVADEAVEASKKYLERLKASMMQQGLIDSNVRVLAPLESKELVVGQVLGKGGFCSVDEVLSIHPRRRYVGDRAVPYSPKEETSREFVAARAQIYHKPVTDINHCQKSVYDSDASSVKKKIHRTSAFESVVPDGRFAVKHLRNDLGNRLPNKFIRAAADLVSEGQLLLALDHPNIVGIHGWSSKGPEALRSGNTRDLFLILDKLPLTLDEQMLLWRKQLRKYQTKLFRRRARRRGVLQTFFRRRLHPQNADAKREKDEEPDKYTIKLQQLFLERVRCAQKIASAIKYMHSKRILHRDIKTSNVGFDK